MPLSVKDPMRERTIAPVIFDDLNGIGLLLGRFSFSFALDIKGCFGATAPAPLVQLPHAFIKGLAKQMLRHHVSGIVSP